MEIGPDDGEGADVFHLAVCNSTYFAVEARIDKYVWLRAYLLVDTWDLGAIRAHIERLCARIEKPTWDEVGAELDRYLDWEFHNYVHHDRR